MNNKLCIYASPFPRSRSNYEKIDTAKQYNLTGVECFSNVDFSSPDEELAKRMKAHADEVNISFPCFSVYSNFAVDNCDAVIERLKGFARVAKIMNCPYLHHTIIPMLDTQKVIPYKQEYYKKGIECVREVYDYADNLGVKTIYEDQGYIFNGVEGIGNFLSDVKRDVGLVADFGNIYSTNYTIMDFLKAFGEKICHVHLKDIAISEKSINDGAIKTLSGNYYTEVPMGHGIIDFNEAFQYLKSIDYDGYFGIEYCVDDDNSPLYDETLEYIKNIMLNLC